MVDWNSFKPNKSIYTCHLITWCKFGTCWVRDCKWAIINPIYAWGIRVDKIDINENDFYLDLTKISVIGRTRGNSDDDLSRACEVTSKTKIDGLTVNICVYCI